MKFKKYIAVLLALVTLLFSGCDDLVNEILNGNFPSDFEIDFFEEEEDRSNESSEYEYEARGRIYSKESDLLVLIAAWNAVAIDEKTVEVTVRVGLKCYEISTERHDLTITVNGEEQTVQTPPIESKTNDQPILLAKTTFLVKLSRAYRGELDISAVWNYNGEYNGVAIDTLTAAARVSFPDGETITQESDTAETETTTDSTESSDTSEPKPDPNAPLYQESGEIYSTESNMLVLFAQWTAVSKKGKTVTVTVTPGIECYKLRTGGHLLTIRVNDSSAKYTTAPIEHGANEKTTLSFTPKEFVIELTDDEPLLLNISVEWEYNDTDGYNADVIEKLTAETTVTFPGGQEIIPQAGEPVAEEINENLI